MDRECFTLLPGVCLVLADPRQSLPDDTSLEKLLDWLSGLTRAGGGRGPPLLETLPCLSEFLSTVFHNKTTDPSILSFALRLTGLLGAGEDGFRLLQDHSLLGVAYDSDGWREAGLWGDPCVRIGWIQGLTSMLQHRLALQFLVQEGLTRPLLQLQTDPSLFVASAANQLLAHLMVFFQPMGSAGGEQEAGRDAGPERLAVATDTSPEHAGVAAAIMKHLEVSLASEEEHLQMVQSLRLLGLLLAQTRAPLWGALLRRVSGSLEQLVGAGRSALILPVMDVLLTASSPPVPDSDPTISRLLGAILDSQNPSDVIHAAATLLQRNHRHPAHTPKAVGTVLMPLEMITGVSLLGTHTAGGGVAAGDRRPLLAELLNRKSSCVSILSVCLSCTTQLAHMPADFLPAPPVSVIAAVMSLLRICLGHAPPSGTQPIGCRKACTNLIGCGRVQGRGLEALSGLSSCPGALEMVEEVLLLLLLYLQSPDSDPTVCKKAYQTLLRWLGVCSHIPAVTDLLRRELLPVLRKRVCDVRWEVRDSTLEFLGQLPGVCEEEEEEEEEEGAGLGRSAAVLLVEALSDAEGYVRASAVSGLALTLLRGRLREAPLEQMAVVPRLLEILSQDSEGFPRRAVLQFFITWLRTSPSSSSSSSSWSLATPLRSVLSLGSADLDWEVKVHTLELAELLLEEALPGRLGSPPPRPCAPTPTPPRRGYGGREGTGVASALSVLVEQGVVRVLMDAASDCDRPVALKACSLLLALRSALCPVAGVTRGQPRGREVAGGKGLETRRGGKGCDWPREAGESGSDGRSDGSDEAGGSEARDRPGEEVGGSRGGESEKDGEGVRASVCESEEGVCVSEEGVCESVCEALWRLGLEERESVLSQSSDHVQNSPLSLLQDILAATQPSEDVIVDCY